MSDEIKTITLREHFAKRPGMYIGKAGMERFQFWIMGIRIAEDTHLIPEAKRVFPYLREFEGYLKQKFKRYTGSRGTYGWALRRAKEDDEAAFHLWMKWYDEFMAERHPCSSG